MSDDLLTPGDDQELANLREVWGEAIEDAFVEPVVEQEESLTDAIARALKGGILSSTLTQEEVESLRKLYSTDFSQIFAEYVKLREFVPSKYFVGGSLESTVRSVNPKSPYANEMIGLVNGLIGRADKWVANTAEVIGLDDEASLERLNNRFLKYQRTEGMDTVAMETISLDYLDSRFRVLEVLLEQPLSKSYDQRKQNHDGCHREIVSYVIDENDRIVGFTYYTNYPGVNNAEIPTPVMIGYCFDVPDLMWGISAKGSFDNRLRNNNTYIYERALSFATARVNEISGEFNRLLKK